MSTNITFRDINDINFVKFACSTGVAVHTDQPAEYWNKLIIRGIDPNRFIKELSIYGGSWDSKVVGLFVDLPDGRVQYQRFVTRLEAFND